MSVHLNFKKNNLWVQYNGGSVTHFDIIKEKPIKEDSYYVDKDYDYSYNDIIKMNCNKYKYEGSLCTLPSPLPIELEYLDCSFNKRLLVLPELPITLTHLNISNTSCILPGILPPNLKRLLLFNCDHSELPPLPPSLEQLYCKGNKLTKLPDLPSSLEELNCSENEISELPSIEHTKLTYLGCGKNWLTKLPELPKTLIKLNCSCNQITEISKVPYMLESLICFGNRLEDLPNIILDRFLNYRISYSVKEYKLSYNDNPVADKINNEYFGNIENYLDYRYGT